MSRLRSRVLKATVPAAIMTTAAVGFGPAAFAHEVRPVGAITMTVGWGVEPAYVGQANEVQLFLHQGSADGKTIDDIGDPSTLKVQVTFGSQTGSQLDLAANYDSDTGLGTKGEFDAPLIPTQAGDYSFHFTGTVNGQKVDQTFKSGPTTFATVTDPKGDEFPTQTPTAQSVSDLVGRLSTRVDAASSAKSKADTAQTMGIVGIAVGAVALLVAIGGVAVSGRKKS